MLTQLPALHGNVKIEVIENGEVVYLASNPNTLVLEAPKLLFANMLANSLVTVDTFSNSDVTRPTITPGTGGPSGKHAISYIGLGYYLDAEDETSPVAAATDKELGLAEDHTVFKLLTDANLGEYSMDLVCAFTVVAGEADRNFVEAGLFCPSLSASWDSTTQPYAHDHESFSKDDLVLFAHQSHAAVQGNVGSTIKYTWTITMQAPS